MAFSRSDFQRIIKMTLRLQRVWLLAMLVGLYSLISVYKEFSAYSDVGDFPSIIFTVLGLVLSLMLAFRTNRAYEFLNVCGGCERICNTRIAGSDRSYATKCLVLYLLACRGDWYTISNG